jgi:hypothetical protein
MDGFLPFTLRSCGLLLVRSAQALDPQAEIADCITRELIPHFAPKNSSTIVLLTGE